jgi:hypothetical protein
MTPLPPSARSARGLYLITPEEPDTARLLARVAEVLPQAAWLQYRQKAQMTLGATCRPPPCRRSARRRACR